MLYDVGFFIFSIIYLPALIFKGKLHKDFSERFALYDKDKIESLKLKGRKKIWIQAVSVGEVALCKSFIPLLKRELPGYEIVLSTITKTGNDLAKRLFSNDAVIIYFPLDFSFVVRRAVRLIGPKIFIMIETEIWPNLLNELERQGIPSALVNGRISDRSFGKYKLAVTFLKKVLSKIGTFCMQSGTDAERIIQLGAPEERVNITGNMKFDAEIKMDPDAAQDVRKVLGLDNDEELLVAGSTHSGEEEIVLKSFITLVKEFPRLKLLIAPRHVDRAGEIKAMVRRSGLEERAIVLDTVGQLRSIYQIAALVFIGGSLVKHGGQNPIEPAVFERPIIFGPNMFNFKGIARAFVEGGGAIQISNGDDLSKEAAILLRDERSKNSLGRNAKRIVLENRGATDKNLKRIKGLIQA